MADDTLSTQWVEAKTLFELLEKDVDKNLRGNIAAGVRVRRGLRELRQLLTVVGKRTLENDRAKVELKKSKKVG